MLKRHGIALAAMLGMVGALVPVLAATAEEPAARESPPELTWEACPAGIVAPVPLQVQCAKVPVPLDYAKPDGTQITLTISRIASTKPEKRRGILMFNPGGPGGSGLDQPAF